MYACMHTILKVIDDRDDNIIKNVYMNFRAGIYMHTCMHARVEVRYEGSN